MPYRLVSALAHKSKTMVLYELGPHKIWLRRNEKKKIDKLTERLNDLEDNGKDKTRLFKDLYTKYMRIMRRACRRHELTTVDHTCGWNAK